MRGITAPTLGRTTPEGAAAAPPRSVDVPLPARERQGRWLAWTAVVTLCAVVAGMLGAGHGTALGYLYPVICLTLGVYLYASHPDLFVGFVLWLWILSPLVRRLADYQSGWNPTNWIIVTPVLVTSLTAWTAVRYAPRLRGRHRFPLALALLSTVLGFTVGIFRNGISAAGYGLVSWAGPILFGLYVALEWRRFPEFRAVMQSVMVWGALIMGVYGLAQYFRPQPWDQFWMFHSDMSSIGTAEAYQVRVFSTLNSPGVLAAVCIAALLVTLGSRGALRWPAAAAATIALLLSVVRSAWLACILALLAYVSLLPGAWRRLYSVLGIAATGLLVATALLVGPVRKTISSRVETLQDVTSDHSYLQRLRSAVEILGEIAADPLGGGLGASGGSGRLQDAHQTLTFDNGVLEIVYSLGWIGGLAFLAALAWTGVAAWTASRRSMDPLCLAGVAAWVGALALLSSGNAMVSASGVCFWGLVGLAIASGDHVRAVERSTSTIPAG